MRKEASEVSNRLWAIYNPNTKTFEENGRLVYQKRVNGLFYDSQTNKPLRPQPPQYIEDMRRRGRQIAAKYQPATAN